MNNDDRNNMIQHICENWSSWEGFYNQVVGDSFINNTRKVDGWYVCWEGERIEDLYLQGRHPSGDEKGEVITCGDCFDEHP